MARAMFAPLIGSPASSSQNMICRYSSSATVALAMSAMLPSVASPVLDRAPQCVEPAVPLGPHHLDPLGSVVERLRAQLVVGLSTHTGRADELGAPQGGEVLGDRLSRDRKLLRQAAR